MFVWACSDKYVTRRYVSAGKRFGEAVSVLRVMGECVGFEYALDAYEKWERVYAERGYETIPLKDFVLAGGYGRHLPELNAIHDMDEEHTYYAAQYREMYLGRAQPIYNISEMLSGSGN